MQILKVTGIWGKKNVVLTLFSITLLGADLSDRSNLHKQKNGGHEGVKRSERYGVEASTSKGNDKYLALCGKNEKPTTLSPKGTNALDAKTLAAYNLLRSKCASCHNPGSASGAQTFKDVLNVEELLTKGIVDLKKGNASSLIERVEDDSMPQGGKPLTADEKKVLKDWLASGAKSFSPEAVLPEVGFISNSDIEACMVKDLRNVAKEDRPYVRYFNLNTLYNAGRKGELEQNRLALNKLLNSLSWNKEIKNPVVVDGTGTLLRFDLRDYRWTPQMWERVAKRNPYPESVESAKKEELIEKTHTKTPYLRGDWFVFTIFNKKDVNDLKEEFLYHTLLYDLPKLAVRVGKKDAPNSLEKLLSVDSKEDEENGAMTRAGFRQSNVTKSNRTIQRHETPYGSYWKSDDFKTRVKEQNIFEHPLDYKIDGGEFIYSLPNKLHGYLVTDAKGTRLDGAPTDVVVDPARIHKDGVVLNGISCMNCHTSGIKKRNDEILPHFNSLEPLLKKHPNPHLQDLIHQVKRVYKPNTLLNKHFTQDEKDYLEALKKTENSTDRPDPVFATSTQFEAPLDIKTMAAELGHDPKKVEELFNNNLEIRQRLAIGTQKTVDREVFNEHFTSLRELLESREPVARYHAQPNKDGVLDFLEKAVNWEKKGPTCEGCYLEKNTKEFFYYRSYGVQTSTPDFKTKEACYQALKEDEYCNGKRKGNPFTRDIFNFNFVRVEPGTFMMGSPDHETGREKNETLHQVTLTKPFEIQTTEVSKFLFNNIMKLEGGSGSKSPKDGLTWKSVHQFIDKLNALNGQNCGRSATVAGFKKSQSTPGCFRLPTEAEWEYAVRGGHKVDEHQRGNAYFFGNDPSILHKYGFSQFPESRLRANDDVGDRLPNPLGLHGVYGNVSELVQDGFVEDLGKESVKDPFHGVEESEAASGNVVVRGGNQYSPPAAMRSASRNKPATSNNVYTNHETEFGTTGFRLVRTLDPLANQ